MSLDLGGPAIEIAIALAFVFFLLSLIVSQVNELIAGAFKLRAKNLKEGLKGMIGDESVVERLLCHPLVRTDLAPGKRRDPSYISPKNFALSFRDLAEREPDLVARASDDLTTQLRALKDAPDAPLPELSALEKWFDDSMDRVSGWYKRRTQWITLGIAVALVLLLNVSTLRVAEQLSAEPKVLANVVAKAEAAAGEEGPGEGQAGGGEEGTSEMKKAGEEAEAAVDDLAALSLPVFWTEEKNRPNSGEEWLIAVAGWLLTILAVSLGAPFWFDTLGKLSNLRMAGKKPEEKPAASAP
jgi:hypothetical protein